MKGVWILTQETTTANTQAFSSLSVLVKVFPDLHKKRQAIYRAARRNVAHCFDFDGVSYSLQRVPMFRPKDV